MKRILLTTLATLSLASTPCSAWWPFCTTEDTAIYDVSELTKFFVTHSHYVYGVHFDDKNNSVCVSVRTPYSQIEDIVKKLKTFEYVTQVKHTCTLSAKELKQLDGLIFCMEPALPYDILITLKPNAYKALRLALEDTTAYNIISELQKLQQKLLVGQQICKIAFDDKDTVHFLLVTYSQDQKIQKILLEKFTKQARNLSCVVNINYSDTDFEIFQPLPIYKTPNYNFSVISIALTSQAFNVLRLAMTQDTQSV